MRSKDGEREVPCGRVLAADRQIRGVMGNQDLAKFAVAVEREVSFPR
ncbi:MAG TPA: hypothetical protein VGF91_02030 [Solirubrobacteraceae bacterium]|jgi:hypothetical protein